LRAFGLGDPSEISRVLRRIPQRVKLPFECRIYVSVSGIELDDVLLM
jgi:hypothetical protein